MVHAQPRIRPTKLDAQTHLGFWDTNGSPNLGKTKKYTKNEKTKKTNKTQIKQPHQKTRCIVDFAV